MEEEEVGRTSLDDLPDEVLEFVLSFLSPYEDLQNCARVSEKWRQLVPNVLKLKYRNFRKAINEMDVKWTAVHPPKAGPAIARRYSHAAAVHDNSMYVFGGCTCAMTTFNDLWRLDLGTREWSRPLTTGRYPSPKTCSSLARYKDKLVLFGGWTYPPSYPLHQGWHLFDELHVYDIPTSQWSSIANTWSQGPPPMAGHSVSVIGNSMIVFGGLQKAHSAVHCEKSNAVWVLDLNTMAWQQPDVGKTAPSGRFGQTQVVLDERNIMILGGSNGPYLYYSDAWRLDMSEKTWQWRKIRVDGAPNEPTNMWSNPGCKIGDRIVMLNKVRGGSTPPGGLNVKSGVLKNAEASGSRRIDLAGRQRDEDVNVNGRRGEFLREVHKEPISKMQAFRMKYKITMEGRQPEKRGASLGVYVLDVSRCLDDEPVATWLPPKPLAGASSSSAAAEETMLYSLVEGNSELVMFGGILRTPADVAMGYSTNLGNQISNSLHFISAPNYTI